MGGDDGKGLEAQKGPHTNNMQPLKVGFFKSRK